MFLLLTFNKHGHIDINMAKPQGMFYEALGTKIRQARIERNFSQGEMARVVGLSRTSITNIERGRQPVQAHVLVQIAETLNVNLSTLLTIERSQSDKDTKEDLKKFEPSIREWVEGIIGMESTPKAPGKK